MHRKPVVLTLALLAGLVVSFPGLAAGPVPPAVAAREARMAYELASAAFRAHRLEDAERLAAASAQRDPARPEPLFLLGRVRYQKARYREAAEAWSDALVRALQLPPPERAGLDLPRARLQLGEAWLASGEIEKAAAAFTAARESLPASGPDTARALGRLAAIRLQQGNLDQARAAAQGAVVADPSDAAAKKLLGRVLLALGDAEGARSALEAAREAGDRDPEILSDLGQTLERLGLGKEAAEARATYQEEKAAAEAERKRRAGVERAREEGLRAASQGQYVTAASKLEEAARLSGDDPTVLAELGVLHNEMGRTGDAVQMLRRALAARDDLPMAHFTLGTLEAEAGRPFRALDHLARAVELDPGLWLARFNLGNVYVQIGRPDAAIAQYQEAMLLNPVAPDVRQALATLLRAVGDERRAALAEGPAEPGQAPEPEPGQAPEPEPGQAPEPEPGQAPEPEQQP